MNNDNKKLERKRNGDIAGVCAGISDYYNMDSGLVKIIFFVLLFTPFPIFWVYIILWICLSKEPKY